LPGFLQLYSVLKNDESWVERLDRKPLDWKTSNPVSAACLFKRLEVKPLHLGTFFPSDVQFVAPESAPEILFASHPPWASVGLDCHVA
jgi:hypothetical protein